jgi:hypothetical protein
MTDVIPTKPDVVLKNWQFYAEGIKSIVEHSYPMTMIELYNGIMSGQFMFYTVFEDNKYVGCMMTSFSQVPQGVSQLSLNGGYLKPGTGNNVWFDAVKYIEDIARSQKINEMRFFTNRYKAYERKLKDKGWEIRQVEFVKEVV